MFFEDVFAQLGSTAVWQNELTEVAFWNAPKRAFADCYEVLRVGDTFYFRSIPHLTRPVMTEGVPTNSPIQFTLPIGASNLTESSESERGRSGFRIVLRPPDTPPVLPVTAPSVPPPQMPPIEIPRTEKR